MIVFVVHGFVFCQSNTMVDVHNNEINCPNAIDHEVGNGAANK